jgi:hypothetical protein
MMNDIVINPWRICTSKAVKDVGHEASDELCSDGSLAHSTWSFCCTIDRSCIAARASYCHSYRCVHHFAKICVVDKSTVFICSDSYAWKTLTMHAIEKME